MPDRALTFGAAAEAYERFRPGYPDAVADAILTYAHRPIRTALEIGAGTGKATRLLAAHGVDVTATEPDAAMLEQLRANVPSSVTAVQAAFEDLAPTGTYDLVFAAAALHWTVADRRWSNIAAVLAPRGVFASFGGPIYLADPAVEDAVRAARAPWLEDDDVPSPDGTPPTSAMQWPGTELERSEEFADVRQLRIERRHRMTRDDYVGLLSTISAYLELPDADRRHALARIHDVLPARVEVVADVDVHLARLT